MLRQEIKLRLGTVRPAFAGHAAGADGDLRLDHVVAAAERVGFRIEEDADAVFLVFAQGVLPHERQADAGQCPETEDPAPRNPSQQNHRHSDGGNQERRTQVRLDRDQPGCPGYECQCKGHAER